MNVEEAREIVESERFQSKINKSGDCWLWTAAVNSNGYGVFSLKVDGKWNNVYAHRVVCLAATGEEAQTTDHLCRTKTCVRPDHLEAVSIRENVLRGNRGVLKTYCAQGHPWVEENIYVKKDGGRCCHVCLRERDKVRWV